MMSAAVLAAGALPMIASAQTADQVTLRSIVLTPTQVQTTYTKNFATCVHMVTANYGIIHTQNHFCANGPITITVPRTAFTSAMQVGAKFKLCHGNNYGVCSQLVTVTAGQDPSADLAMSKSGPSTVAQGSQLAYTLTVRNLGPGTASNVLVKDALPANLTFQSGPGCSVTSGVLTCAILSIPAGQTYTFTATFGTANVGCNTQMINKATVSAATADPNQANNTSSAVTTSVTCAPKADLSLTKTAAQSVPRGTNLVYTLTARNNGPDVASSVMVYDALPSNLTVVSAPGCTFTGPNISCSAGTMAAGASRTFSITAGTSAAACETVVNYAKVTSVTADPNTTNNNASASTLITCRAENQADLSITKSGPSSVNLGATISYTLTIKNNGPTASLKTQVVDYPSNGLIFAGGSPECTLNGTDVMCGIGSLAAGQTKVLRLDFSTNKLSCGEAVKNYATVSSPVLDPNLSNNTSETVVTTVTCPQAENELTIAINGPATQSYARGQQNANLANVILTPKSGTIAMQRLYIAVQGQTSAGGNLATTNGTATDDIAEVLQGIEIRNIVTGAVTAGTRLTGSADFGQTAAGTFQIYRFDSFSFNAAQTYEFRVDVLDNGVTSSPRTGDQFKILICAEPVLTPAGPNTAKCFSSLISGGGSTAYQVAAQDLSSGAPIRIVHPGGTVAGNLHQIASATLNVTVKALASSDVAVKNEKNVTLLAFEARANDGDVLATDFVFDAQSGNLVNAQNYKLWVDTNADNVVDTILQSGVSAIGGRVTFSQLTGGGYVVSLGQTVRFEVHADIASSLSTPPSLQLQFARSLPDYISAEDLPTGATLSGIETDGVCATTCKIIVTTVPSTNWTILSQGDLFVTQSTTPVRSRMLLGGTLADEVLRLQLRAQYEDIDVTLLTIVTGGSNSSVDRYELYRVGETTPFASATIGGCGPGYGSNVSCARMQNRQLVVPDGQIVNVLVRPRLRTDTDGAVSGQVVDPQVIDLIGADDITARGGFSSNNLSPNDGDGLAEGEVFIGTSNPGANASIIGKVNHVVLSKVVSITNADPNSNGTVVPTGPQRAIGQFKFTAAANNNFKNGLNKFTVDGLIFNVNATNVAMNAANFKFYNKADSFTKAVCTPKNLTGSTITGTATGVFYVECSSLTTTSAVNTQIDQGTDQTFVLEGEITNAKVLNSQASVLQTSIQQFTDIGATAFSQFASHVKWFDRDTTSTTFLWIEYSDTTVNSTRYEA